MSKQPKNETPPRNWGGRRENQTGRPRTESDPMFSTGFVVTARLLEKVQRRAAADGVSRSKALRSIIEESA